MYRNIFYIAPWEEEVTGFSEDSLSSIMFAAACKYATHYVHAVSKPSKLYEPLLKFLMMSSVNNSLDKTQQRTLLVLQSP